MKVTWSGMYVNPLFTPLLFSSTWIYMGPWKKDKLKSQGIKKTWSHSTYSTHEFLITVDGWMVKSTAETADIWLQLYSQAGVGPFKKLQSEKWAYERTQSSLHQWFPLHFMGQEEENNWKFWQVGRGGVERYYNVLQNKQRIKEQY